MGTGLGVELGRALTELVGDEIEHGHRCEHRGRREVDLEHGAAVGEHHLVRVRVRVRVRVGRAGTHGSE